MSSSDAVSIEGGGGQKGMLNDEDDGMATPTTRSDRFYDPTGDLVIITSDHVKMRVHAYLLQANSEVFRDLISESADLRIHLQDGTLETNYVFSAFLDTMIEQTSLLSFDRARSLLVFQLARQYACTGLLNRIALQLHRELHQDSRNSLDVFLMGLELDDQDLCLQAMTSRQLVPCHGEVDADDEDFGESLPGASAMDPTALDIGDFRSVASKTLWAWFRAHRKGFPLQVRPNDKQGLKAMRAEFQRLMQLPDAPDNLHSEHDD